MKALWRNKWFILVVVVSVFFVATSAKVVMAGEETEFAQILAAYLDGLEAYFDSLLEVLNVIW